MNRNQKQKSVPQDVREALKEELEITKLEMTKRRLFAEGLAWALPISALFCLFFYYQKPKDEFLAMPEIIIALATGVVLGLINSFYTYLKAELKVTQLNHALAKYDTETMQKEIDKDLFENSIKMSYKYLDQYYLQTREQAQRGFFITMVVSIFGALLIAAGIIAMFLGKTAPSYVTCASGIVTEFIATVFFYLYNRTITGMSKYHNKLVLSQNISIALKIADSLPDAEKKVNKSLIISELMKDINIHMIKSDMPEQTK